MPLSKMINRAAYYGRGNGTISSGKPIKNSPPTNTKVLRSAIDGTALISAITGQPLTSAIA